MFSVYVSWLIKNNSSPSVAFTSSISWQVVRNALKKISFSLSKCAFLDLTPDLPNQKLIQPEFRPSAPPSPCLCCTLKSENRWSRRIPLPLYDILSWKRPGQLSCRMSGFQVSLIISWGWGPGHIFTSHQNFTLPHSVNCCLITWLWEVCTCFFVVLLDWRSFDRNVNISGC